MDLEEGRVSGDGLKSEPTLPTTCWTPERQTIKQWLVAEAPTLAELFEGLVRLLFEHRPPGYTHFVGHAVREIGNRLPSAISGNQSSSRLDYKGRLDTITEQWKRAGFATDGTLRGIAPTPNFVQSRPAEFAIPLSLVRSISKLVADHEVTREKPLDAAEKLFMGVNPENKQAPDAIRPAITQWLEVTDWFMEITHVSLELNAPIDDSELRAKFALFETALLAMAQEFFRTTDDLDELLEETNR